MRRMICHGRPHRSSRFRIIFIWSISACCPAIISLQSAWISVSAIDAFSHMSRAPARCGIIDFKNWRSAIAVCLAVGPAFAEDMCSDAHMKQMDGMIANLTDPAKQKEATAALDQSKAAMKAGDNAGCMKYMAEAHKAMGI